MERAKEQGFWEAQEPDSLGASTSVAPPLCTALAKYDSGPACMAAVDQSDQPETVLE